MPTETCGACGVELAMGDMVHVLVHTRTDAGVLDAYVCRACYTDDLAPLVEDGDPA